MDCLKRKDNNSSVLMVQFQAHDPTGREVVSLNDTFSSEHLPNTPFVSKLDVTAHTYKLHTLQLLGSCEILSFLNLMNAPTHSKICHFFFRSIQF